MTETTVTGKVNKMALEGVWKRKTRRFENGWDLYVGMWIVAQVYFDSTYADRSKPEASLCNLPRMKSFGKINHTTTELAMMRAEVEVKSWFKHAMSVDELEFTTKVEGEK